MTGDSMGDPLEIQCPYCGESLIESRITDVGIIPKLGTNEKKDRFYFRHIVNKDSKCPVYDGFLTLGYRAL